MYRFLTKFRWFRKLLGRDWKLVASKYEPIPMWVNWDLFIKNAKMMEAFESEIIKVIVSESY